MVAGFRAWFGCSGRYCDYKLGAWGPCDRTVLYVDRDGGHKNLHVIKLHGLYMHTHKNDCM